jgi:hypothetical protein
MDDKDKRISELLDEVARLTTERNEWREKYVRSPDHSEEQFQREEITRLEAELREAKALLATAQVDADNPTYWIDECVMKREERDKLAEELRIARDSMQLVYVNQDADTLRELVVTQEKLAHARVANHQAWERIRTSEIERDAARKELADLREENASLRIPIEKDLKQLAEGYEEQLTAARAEVGELREALKFYAIKDNWQDRWVDYDNENGGDVFDVINVLDVDVENIGEEGEPCYTYGGKRARAALAQVEKLEGESE